MLREATPPGRMIAKLFVPVLLVVALGAAIGIGGLDRVRAARSVSAYTRTVALPGADAATALAVELAATTGGGDLASARAATDAAVAAAVDAVRALDDARQDDATSALLVQAESLATDVAAVRQQVDAGQDGAAAASAYLEVADAAAGWPLDLVRTADTGRTVGAQLVVLARETADLVAAGAASGSVGTDARDVLVALADETDAAASAEVTRQAGLAAAVVVALLLAGACVWLARGRRRTTAAEVPDEAPRSAPDRPAGAPAAARPTSLRSAGSAVVPVHECGSAAALAAARRDLALLNRQLVSLDTLEQTEEDPTVLAELFELDNLTVRLRRNAESLLVLAGSEHGRRVREVTPVADVLRAAASQIEQYDRVQIALVHDPYLHASHVVPVAHLFAELMENATAFAEPITPIEITGACDAEQMTIEVRDAGVGMAPADLAMANAQLAAAEDVSDGRMGLRVVARLAARLGIEVRLRPGPDGAGTVAVVRLPRSLFAEPDAAQAASPSATAAAEPVVSSAVVPPQLTAAQLTMPLVEPTNAGPAFEPVHPATSAPDAPLPRRLPAPTAAPVAERPATSAPVPAWRPVVSAQQPGLPTFDAVLGTEQAGAVPVPEPSGSARTRGSRRLSSRRDRRSEPSPSGSAGPANGTVGVGGPAALPPVPVPGAPVQPSGAARPGVPAAPPLAVPDQEPASVAGAPAPTGVFVPGATLVPERAPASSAVPATSVHGAASAGSFRPGSVEAPAPTRPVPAAASGFAPAASAFTPAEPGCTPGGAESWTGGGVDTSAGIRAAGQKAAMAELSGLTSYRPAAGTAGSSLPPRSPSPVAPPADDPTAQPVERDADELRQRFSAFRSGTSRGRDERSSTLLGP
ncbi:MAG TPA: ATP-binding protein [Cellulomonas sp.]